MTLVGWSCKTKQKAANTLLLHHGSKVLLTSLLHLAVLLQRYLKNVCSIDPANVLQPQSSKKIWFPCKIFAAFTLQNVCSIQPANNLQRLPKKCLKHPTCKQFAASNLQTICSIQPANNLQHPICKQFAAFTLKIVCSI